tara:strand:+ start:811 stop:1005 length:195 start_codon:yes stop_codon:yes gene_type:complete
MKKTILRNKHDDYSADEVKETTYNFPTRERRAPDESDREWAREIHHKLDVIEGKLDFLLKYLEL